MASWSWLVEVAVERVEIVLRADAGDLAGDVEDRMGHLAGDHVHLVGMGGGDHHVGVAGACPFQHVGVAGEADDALHVQRVGRAAHEIGVHVDHGDVVLFAGQVAGDLPADLPRPADDDLHDVSVAPGPRGTM